MRYQVSKSEVYRKFVMDEGSPELEAELAIQTHIKSLLREGTILEWDDLIRVARDH